MSASLSSLAAVGLALLVASCGVSAKPRSAEKPPFAWTLAQEAPARLVYGIPDTDIAGLAFSCQPGSGVVSFVYVGDENPAAARAYGERWRSTVTLASGRASRSYDANSRSGDLGPEHEGQTSVADPVLQAFARSGAITLNRVDQNAWDDQDRAAIGRFFRLCQPA